MSRFYTITILFTLTALGAGLSLQTPVRYFVLGLLVGAYFVVFALGISVLKFNFFLKAICRGDSSARQVALTFDDGPDPVCTPELLKVLKTHNIKAAFFSIGAKLRKYPEVVRRIDQEGHIIGNHSFRHVWWTNFLISRPLDQEIQNTQEAVVAAIGKVPAYFRPPIGLTNPHLGGKLKKHGLTAIGWDIRSFDTRRRNDRVIAEVLRKARNGSIILLHETTREASELVALISALVTGLRAKGFSIVGLEELVGIKAYQTTEEGTGNESNLPIEAELEAGEFRKQGGFRIFLAKKLIAAAYIKKAIKEPVTLDAFKTRPSPRFLWGVSFVLISYILGWPMVGLFSVLAAYFQTPALLVVGPAFYGFSHLVFLFGMYFAGRDCIRYADIMLRWALRQTVEGVLLRRIP